MYTRTPSGHQHFFTRYVRTLWDRYNSVKHGQVKETIFCPPGGSLVSPESQKSLVGVASLLGIEVEELRRSLTSRVMTTTKGGAVGTIIKWETYHHSVIRFDPSFFLKNWYIKPSVVSLSKACRLPIVFSWEIWWGELPADHYAIILSSPFSLYTVFPLNQTRPAMPVMLWLRLSISVSLTTLLDESTKGLPSPPPLTTSEFWISLDLVSICTIFPQWSVMACNSE